MSSAYDLVGPVLPQALRLARYQASASLPKNINNLQYENNTINHSPSREEEHLLASNASVLMSFYVVTKMRRPTIYDHDGPYTKFLTRAFSEIIQERKVTTPSGYVGIILDDVHWHSEHQRCHHCGYDDDRTLKRMLPCLWSKTNWDDLKRRLDRDDVVAGNLSFNLVEKPLIQALKGDWSRLLHEMFGYRSDDYAQWSKEDWVCTDCWSDFIYDTLWRWRLAQKRKAHKNGLQVRTFSEILCRPHEPGHNSRYGYDCEEQCDENGFAHAKKFNHLCEPIEDPSETSEA
ncbi:hypothetical protein OG21DRAFT_1484309 [Imleria badia]|nr:hypothetical protein OG21DRAFT_1484309 [Imleria badia]